MVSDVEVRREMAAEAGGHLLIPAVNKFDSNIITPGTAYMARVGSWMRAHFRERMQSDPRYKKIKVSSRSDGLVGLTFLLDH